MSSTTTIRKRGKKPYSTTKPPRKPRTTSTAMDDNAINLHVSDEDLLKSDSEPDPTASDITSIDARVPDVQLAKDEMMSLLKEIRDSQSSLCTKHDLQEHSQSITKKFSEVDRRVSANSSTINSVASRLSKIESSLELNKHDNELAKQAVISRNLSIMGIPPSDNEDLVSLVLNIFSLAGNVTARDEIFGCYRVKNGNTLTNIIIVKLNNPATKFQILKSKSNKELKVKDVYQSTESNDNRSVYINNHVTPFFGKLLSEGRKSVKDKLIHSVRLTKDGCRVRFDADGEEKIYRSTSELQALISSRHNRPKDRLSTNRNKRPRSGDNGVSPTSSRMSKR